MVWNSASVPILLFNEAKFTGWYTSHHAPRLAEACGGDTCTAPKPCGPSQLVHSLAMSFHFQRNICTDVSAGLKAACAGARAQPPSRPAASKVFIIFISVSLYFVFWEMLQPR